MMQVPQQLPGQPILFYTSTYIDKKLTTCSDIIIFTKKNVVGVHYFMNASYEKVLPYLL